MTNRFEDGPDWRMFDGFGFWPVNMSRIVYRYRRFIRCFLEKLNVSQLVIRSFSCLNTRIMRISETEPENIAIYCICLTFLCILTLI